MASAIEPSWLDTTDVLRQAFDPELESVVQRWVTYYLTLELASYPADTPIDPELSSQLLAQAAMEHPVRGFGIGEDSETTQLLARLRWLSTRAPKLNLPMLHELDQGGDVTDFVSMVCYGKRSFAELRKAHLAPLILSLLSREQREALDKRSPAQYELPDGVTREFRYSSESPPILSTRFERLFGLAETPMVDGEPVLLELLAPNKRPVQMTRDLASFWATGYPAVRKELRGRDPKHPWPDDPLTATPGTRRNRKGT
jgi:ATP-dependent helicase HrpB